MVNIFHKATSILNKYLDTFIKIEINYWVLQLERVNIQNETKLTVNMHFHEVK